MDSLERLIPPVGARIQRYELIELVGRGGFGIVFRARQSGLDEDVALKLLLPDGGDLGELQIRFEQEAKLSKQLKHPAAIKVRDFGRTPEGLPFIVSEFIEGRDLEKVIYQEEMTVDRIVRIAGQILGCLAEAHFRGIVHRDLKPPNIMIRDIFGEPDSVKVLDFGIAKVSQQIGGLRTKTGLALGTPYYMSPEQCRGLPDLDGRADLYSLGLIIGECVGRQPVVQGNDTMAVVYAHARSEPHEFIAEVVQSPLYPIIWRAAQKERDKRYPDALSMKMELMAVVGGALTPQAGVGLPTPPPTGPGIQVFAPRTPQASGAPQAIGIPSGQVAPWSGSTKLAPVSAQLDPVADPARTRGWLVGVFALLAVIVVGLVLFAVLNGGARNQAPTATNGAQPAQAAAPPASGQPVVVAPEAESVAQSPVVAEAPEAPVTGSADASTSPVAVAVNAPVEGAPVEGAPVEGAPVDSTATPSAVPASTPSDTAAGTPNDTAAGMPSDTATATATDPSETLAVTAAPAGQPLAEDATPAALPATVAIRIEGSPASARVRLGSETVCRELPCLLERPRGDGTETVRVSASGYEDERVRVALAESSVYVVALRREAPRESPPEEPTTTIPEVPLFVPNH